MAADQLLGALRDPEASAALADALLDAALAQPLTALIDAPATLDLIESLTLSPRGQALFIEWSERLWARSATLLEAQQGQVGALIEAELDEALRSLIGRPFSLPERELRRLLQSPLALELLSAFGRELLERFIKSFSEGLGGGGGGGRSLIGAAGRGALGLASRASRVGRGVLGGLGVEEQLEGAATRFLQGSILTLSDRLAVRLSTPEMGVRFAEARVEIYEAIRALELEEIAAWGDQLDRARFQRELIAVAEQLLSGERLRVQLLKLIEGLLEMGEESPLSELLGDEVVTLLRDALRMQAPPLCARFAESEALRGWARRYLG